MKIFTSTHSLHVMSNLNRSFSLTNVSEKIYIYQVEPKTCFLILFYLHASDTIEEMCVKNVCKFSD